MVAPSINMVVPLVMVVLLVMVAQPMDQSYICRRPSRYVPYKGTFVLYDGTFGASNQGQTLDV